MWLLPLLIVGAIALAAASRSPRERTYGTRQLPPGPGPYRQLAPGLPGSSGGQRLDPPGVPGPISVLGEILRIGQIPPPAVIVCAIAEAQSIGRNDLASDIVDAFVAPVVRQHDRVKVLHERGSCARPRSPRGVADAAPPIDRSSPPETSVIQSSASPRADVAPPPAASSAPPLLTPTMDDEISAVFNTDPTRFMEMVSRTGTLPTAPPAQAAPLPASTSEADALTKYLRQLPGYAAAGVVIDPSTGAEVFEVRWLQGYPVSTLPQTIDGRGVKVTIVDALPVAHAEAGLPQAAEQTRALVPGSPIHGVSDDAWRQFVRHLERESPDFNSSRHIGQYRQRRERLAELGIDPSSIQNSPSSQRAALDADLADAHQHAIAGGVVADHLGRPIMLPGHDAPAQITLSGVLGVIQCAGLEGAVGWLESPNDRKRYPHTTQAFAHTNGVF